MTDTAAQFAARIARWEAKHVREHPTNHNEITVAYAARYGKQYDPAPWCAEGVSIIGLEGGVLPKECVSAGAKDLTDRMARHGLGRTLATVHFPGVISFNYGHGHCGFLLGLTPDRKYGYTFECNTGSGSVGSQRDGDGAYFRRRYLGGDAVHGLADLVYAPTRSGSTTGKSVDRFLRLTSPLMVGQDVVNVKRALNLLGNHLDVRDARYTADVAAVVNLFNQHRGILDKGGRPARGMTLASWARLRADTRSLARP